MQLLLKQCFNYKLCWVSFDTKQNDQMYKTIDTQVMTLASMLSNVRASGVSEGVRVGVCPTLWGERVLRWVYVPDCGCWRVLRWVYVPHCGGERVVNRGCLLLLRQHRLHITRANRL